MKEKKSIGIEQFIPFELINKSIIEYLEKKQIDKEELFQRMLEYNKGENRSKKAANSIYSTITKQTPLLKSIVKNISANDFNKQSSIDKNIISMSLVCLRYPFMYDTLTAFAKLFKVQDSVNREYITQTMASMYGSNRSLQIALDAVLRMVVDSDLIKRLRMGLYALNEIKITSLFAKEAWIYIYYEMNGRKVVSVDELQYEPFLSYISDLNLDWNKTKILKTRIDHNSDVWIEGIK